MIYNPSCSLSLSCQSLRNSCMKLFCFCCPFRRDEKHTPFINQDIDCDGWIYITLHSNEGHSEHRGQPLLPCRFCCNTDSLLLGKLCQVKLISWMCMLYAPFRYCVVKNAILDLKDNICSIPARMFQVFMVQYKPHISLWELAPKTSWKVKQFINKPKQKKR